TSVAIKTKFHPAAWILRSRAHTSKALRTVHSPEYASLSSPSSFFIRDQSFMRIAPTSTVGGMSNGLLFAVTMLDPRENKNCSKVTTLASQIAPVCSWLRTHGKSRLMGL